MENKELIIILRDKGPSPLGEHACPLIQFPYIFFTYLRKLVRGNTAQSIVTFSKFNQLIVQQDYVETTAAIISLNMKAQVLSKIPIELLYLLLREQPLMQ